MKTTKDKLENQDVTSVHVLTEPKKPANRQPPVSVGDENMEEKARENALLIIDEINSEITKLDQAGQAASEVQKLRGLTAKLMKAMGSEGFGEDYYGQYPEAEAKEAINKDQKDVVNLVDDIGAAVTEGEMDINVGESLRDNLRKLATSLGKLDYETMIDEDASQAIFESVHVEGPEGQKPDGMTWDVTIIAEGVSENGLYHDGDNFAELCKMVEGTKIYSNHVKRSEEKFLPERSIKEAVGWLEDCRVEGAKPDRKIKGKAKLVPSAQTIGTDLLHAFREGKTDYLGLSIQAKSKGNFRPMNIKGKPALGVPGYSKHYSTDIVNGASAGGSFDQPIICESISQRRQEQMKKLEELTKEELQDLRPDLFEVEEKPADPVIAESVTEDPKPEAPIADAAMREVINMRAESAIDASKLPETTKNHIREGIIGNDSIGTVKAALAKVKEAIKLFGDYDEARNEKERDNDLPIVEALTSPIQKLSEAWLEYLNPGQDHLKHNPRELFKRTTGDDSMSLRSTPQAKRHFAEAQGYLSEIHLANIREGKSELVRGFMPEMEYWTLGDLIAEVTRANWSDYFGDIIHQAMLEWSKVEPAATYKRDIDLITTKKRLEDFEDSDNYILTGLDALDIVAEDAAYTAFGGGDAIESTSFVPVKRGNTFAITREMLLGDKIGMIRQIPKRIAQVAWFTLWNFIFTTSLFDNPNMSYDAVALIAGGHANDFGAVFSKAELLNAINGMRAQSLPGAAATYAMRLKPVYILAARKNIELMDELISSGNKVNATEDSTLPNFIGRYGLKDYIVNDALATASDRWLVCADPAIHEIFILGFVQGNEDPEIITQDAETTGDVFTNDRMTWKVRHEYGGAVGRHEFWAGDLT